MSTIPARSSSASAPTPTRSGTARSSRVRATSLDHAPTVPNIGSHMGFDATRKLPGEGYTRVWPELVKMNAETKSRVDTLLQAITAK